MGGAPLLEHLLLRPWSCLAGVPLQFWELPLDVFSSVSVLSKFLAPAAQGVLTTAAHFR